MFNEAEPIPGEDTGSHKEQAVVFKGTAEKPKKESWWERTFGAKKTSADQLAHETATDQSAEDSHHRETDVRRLTKHDIAERERAREINRKIDLERAHQEYVPPKPQEKETDNILPDNKEVPKIEDEPGL